MTPLDNGSKQRLLRREKVVQGTDRELCPRRYFLDTGATKAVLSENAFRHLEDEVRIDPNTNKKKKVITRYDIDLKRCMFCGLCEEACPTEPRSIWMTSKTYEGAVYERNEELYFTKDRLLSWEGVKAYPGVITPAEGQMPHDPMGKKKAEEQAGAAE